MVSVTRNSALMVWMQACNAVVAADAIASVVAAGGIPACVRALTAKPLVAAQYLLHTLSVVASNDSAWASVAFLCYEQ
jgi:hypothetical protein